MLDVRFPGRSGLDMQRDLTSAEAQLPIIFITGYGDIAMSVRAMKAGADFLAVIGAVWSHPGGPRAAVREFNQVFARYDRAYS